MSRHLHFPKLPMAWAVNKRVENSLRNMYNHGDLIQYTSPWMNLSVITCLCVLLLDVVTIQTPLQREQLFIPP